MGDDLTRRAFLATSAAGALIGGRADGAELEVERAAQPAEEAAGDAEINAATVAEAQKLAGLEFTEAEREMVARGMDRRVDAYRRRREVELANTLAPASVFDARPFAAALPKRKLMVRGNGDPGKAPLSDADIAFAPVTSLSRWIALGQISSERLTKIYLDRLKRYAGRLECVITLTEELALAQARRADQELLAGRYRGPLHGIPYGAKDLFDTKGIATTWGAQPFRDRVPDADAVVIQRLEAAGAVLVAKTTLGALAMGDVWFGGRTRNPWNIEQGSSGSSAGSAAGVAAGLFAFGLGTETLGSIVSPCMQCGATGLRPTFGRVPRTGAMALCWSLDKVGPICRTVEDCVLVLNAINGADGGDPSSVDALLDYDGEEAVTGVRVGFDPAWFEGRGATDVDRAALSALRRTGVDLREIELPEMVTGPLRTILNVEAAAAFEHLTLSNRDDELVRQDAGAWPNSFRRSWFVPAVELVQADRLRRRACEQMAEAFEGVEVMFGPSFAGSMLLVTNNTGHPSLTLRAGFEEDGQPHGVTLWGRLFDEGTLGRVGLALERELGVWERRPSLGD
jgi:Asp-tRNA(Asn)/Glu-tRNA(Gln) amidotransferase A subunit family amidase